MELKDIKRIVELMKENDLTEFEMEDQGFRLAAKRGGGGPPMIMAPAPAPMMMAAPAAGGAGHPLAAPGAARAAAVPPEEAGWLEIKAPIVGTFYRSPAPDADPFVKLGQTVDEETVVCIVEAMKVMNEIKAEVRGVIRKILVENATPIEFGQVLFKVEPL